MQSESSTATENNSVKIATHRGLGEEVKIEGRYDVKCMRAGEVIWEDDIKNLVVTVGKNDLLDKYLAGSAYTAAWYMGLVDNTSFTAYAAGDTLASHAGWLESLVYTGTNRITVAWNAASAGSKASTSTSFSINATATILGALLTATQARGTASNGGAGVLYSAGSFTGGSRAVLSGDTILVTYTASV